jgi:predicted lysophospholipase L1 biosynthesis ABC-type transport system permease subunit
MLYAAGQARVGAVTIRLAAMQPVRGDLAPKVLVGRLPSADDEIALGRLVADTLGTQVGADLTVEGEAATHRFRVTGLAVVPGVEGLDGVGQDAVLTFGGLTRLDPGAQPSVAAVRLRPGAPPETAQRLAADGGLALDETDLGPGTTPAVILNLARIRSVPFLLGLLVGALAVLTVVHVMVTSVHNRRRDVAVLRALGADGGWITRAVHWQATAFSLVPLALGVPVGLIVGRLVFETFANSIGTVPDASFPFVLLAGMFVGLVVLANAVAEVPARRARRLVPAGLLNPE